MLPSLDQLWGSTRNNKIIHSAIRLICLSSIVLFVFSIYFLHSGKDMLFHAGFERFDVTWFFIAPVVFVSAAVLESVWFRRKNPEVRAVAIDWFFVLAYLMVWCFGLGTVGLPSP